MLAHPFLGALAVPLGVFAFAGCGALDDFEETLQDQATLKGSFFSPAPFSLDYQGGFKNLNLAASRTFQNEGVQPSDVDAIFVKSVLVEGTEPAKDRLDVLLDSMEIFVEAPDVEKKSIAKVSAFPVGASADFIVVPNLNLKPYAVAPSMTMSADVKLKRQPALDTTLKTTIILLIDINLLGT